MKNLLTITLILLGTLNLWSQSEFTWKLGYYSPDGIQEKIIINRNSELILVFKLSIDSAISVLKNREQAISTFNNTKACYEFRIGDFNRNLLPYGNYLLAHVEYGKVALEYFVKSYYSVFLWDINKKQMGLIVLDTNKVQVDEIKVIDEKGKILPFDAKTKAVQIQKKEFQKYIINAGGTVFYQILDSDAMNWWKSYDSKTVGFIALEKPKYKQGDTVHFKAFIYSKKQKPFTKPLTFTLKEDLYRYYSERNKIRQIVINATSPGAYIGSFVMDDSLILDKTFYIHVNFEKNGDLENSFRLEDYRLDDYLLFTEVNYHTIYKGEDLELSITARDFKNEIIRGGRYQITVKSKNFRPTNEESLFIPDVIIKKEGILNSQNPTQFTLKATDIPNLNGTIQLVVQVWNAANVYQSNVLDVNIVKMPRVRLTPVKDSIRYEISEEGSGLLKADFNNKSLLLRSKKGAICVDYTQALPTFTYTYENDDHELNLPTNIHPIINTWRSGDSIFVNLKNPLDLPIRIGAFENSKEVFVKDRIESDTAFYYPYHKKISLRFEYYVDGKYYYRHIELLKLDKQLHIETFLPETVQPGSSHMLKIKVVDDLGNPVSGANITAWAVNQEFSNSNNTQNFGYSTSIRNKKSIYFFAKSSLRKYSTSYNPSMQDRFQISDSNLYYQMLFPKNGLQHSYHLVGGLLAHFAPYVSDKGRFQNIYYIRVDDAPIYYHYAYDGPWSFPFINGFHKVSVRTANKLYVIDSVLFISGMKLELSIDAQNHPKNIKVFDYKKKLDKYECRAIESYLVKFNGNRWSKNYVLQGHRVFQTNGEYSFPMQRGDFIVLNDNNILKGTLGWGDSYIDIKPNGFRYEEQNIKIKANQQKNPYKPREYNSSYSQFGSVGDYSHQIIFKSTQDYSFPPDIPFQIPQHEYCNVSFFNTNDSSMEQQYLYIISTDKSNYFYEKHIINNRLGRSGYSSQTFTYTPGIYTVILYTKSNNLLVYSLEFKKEGTNYVNFAFEKATYIPLNSYRESQQDSILHTLFLKDRLEVFEEKNYYGYHFTHQPTSYDDTRFIIKFSDKDGGYLSSLHLNVFSNNSIVYLPINTSQYVVKKNTSDSAILINDIRFHEGKIFIQSLPAKYDFILYSLTPSAQGLFARETFGKNDFHVEFTDRISSKNSSYREVRSIGGLPVDRMHSGNQKHHKTVLFLDGGATSFNCPSFGVEIEEYISEMEIYEFEDNIPIIDNGLGQELFFTGGTPAMYGDIQDSINFGAMGHIRSNFSDVGFWVPNLITDENGEAVAEIQFPDNITGWRMLVFAAGQRGEQGRYEQDIKAMKQVAVSLAVPRFLVEGDSSAVHTNVVNYSLSPRTLKEYFKVGDIILHSSQLTLDSFSKNEFHVLGQDSSVYVEFGFTGSQGESDAEGRNVSVLPRGSRFAEGSYYKIQRDSTLIIEAGEKEVKFVFYQGILDVLLNDIEEVKAYKYDCNEQLASKLMVLLLQEKVYSQLGKKFKDKREIIKIIKQLENNRKSSFDWGWWKNDADVLWISNHVGTALILAKLSGYKTDYMERNEEISMYYSNYQNPNLDFLLAKLGLFSNPLLFESKSKYKTIEDQLWNFKTKHLLKIPFTIEDVLNLSKTATDGSVYFGVNAYARDENQILCTSLAFEIIYTIDSLHPVLEKMEQFLINRHGYEKLNTYEIAYMAQALLPYYLQKHDAFSPAKITNQDGIEQSFNQVFTIPKGETMRFKIKEGSDVYAASWTEYFDPEPKKVDSLFSIETKFFKDTKEITQFAEGEKIEMNVTIKSKSQADYVMIEIPLPAAAYYLSDDDQRNPYEVHREYYKDRLIIFCSQLPEGSQTFSFSLQVIFNGQFTLNPTTAKEMYYPFFYGRNEIRKVNVGKR